MLFMVVAGGKCVWDDARRALRMFTPDATIVVNDMIGIWPGRMDYAASLHPDKFPKWFAQREANGFNVAGVPRWSCTRQSSYKVDCKMDDWGGSSGLFAVQIALREGATGIVGVGVPMSTDERHILRDKRWVTAPIYYSRWAKHKQELQIFRSMSGMTKADFGEPTPNWLQSLNSAPPDPDGVLAKIGDGDAVEDHT